MSWKKSEVLLRNNHFGGADGDLDVDPNPRISANFAARKGFQKSIAIRFFFVLNSVLVLACLSSRASAQSDIFAPPVKVDVLSPGSYSTAQALFDATRSGEVVKKLRGGDLRYQSNLGKSVLLILQKEYKLDPQRMLGNASGHEDVFGWLTQRLTDFEFPGGKKEIAETFQRQLNDLFGGPNAPGSYRFDDRKFDDSRAIFNKFAGQYVAAVKAYIAATQRNEEQRQNELAKQQHEAAMQERLAAQERSKQKEMSDARLASQQAEDDIKAKAVASALDKAKEARKQKLSEILTSPAYKQWEAALVVQQGEKMISNAQNVLDHDDAVQRESGVTNLSERRAAGEQMVAGKSLVETAFGDYKKLGGKAITPKDVVAGPDPAADYR